MKKLLLIGSLVLVVVGLVVAVAPAREGKNGNKTFSAKLDGFQEVPSISTTGHGKFHAKVNGSSIQYTLKYRNLSSAPQAAHIHLAQEGVNGAIAADLCGGDKPACPTDPAAGTVTGTITAANVKAIPAQGLAANDLAALIRAMKNEATYANIHTTRFGGGEIRGQIDHDDDDDDDDRGHKGKNGNGGNNGGSGKKHDGDDD
jgi:hypothetical protein